MATLVKRTRQTKTPKLPYAGQLETIYHSRVDLLRFLDQRLRFVIYFYDTAMAPFEDLIDKICREDPPYDVDPKTGKRDPSAFQFEFSEADDRRDLVGSASLSYLEVVLHRFLERWVLDLGGQYYLKKVTASAKGNWLERYRVFCLNVLQVDWAKSGVDLRLLEQIVLARNDFHHADNTLMTSFFFQSEYHAQKYPDSVFRHQLWNPDSKLRPRLMVTRDKLVEAVHSVRTLCEFLYHARSG